MLNMRNFERLLSGVSNNIREVQKLPVLGEE